MYIIATFQYKSTTAVHVYIWIKSEEFGQVVSFRLGSQSWWSKSLSICCEDSWANLTLQILKVLVMFWEDQWYHNCCWILKIVCDFIPTFYCFQMQTNTDYIREKVFEVEHGVCQICHLDVHTLYRQIRLVHVHVCWFCAQYTWWNFILKTVEGRLRLLEAKCC